jgi:hypothetical protein
VAPEQRARHDAPSELGEHEHRLGHAEPDAAVRFGQTQREHAHLRQLAMAIAVERRLLELRHVLERVAVVAEGPDPRLESLLIVGELEIHLGPSLACGSLRAPRSGAC